jgi:hypothetical protein
MTEALEEGCGYALNRVLESDDVRDLEFTKPYPGLSDDKRAQLIDRMVHEVEVAIYERFEVPFPDDTQTTADIVKSAGISCRSKIGRRFARYLLERGGLVDRDRGF